jgi:hypothetical protein
MSEERIWPFGNPEQAADDAVVSKKAKTAEDVKEVTTDGTAKE